MENIEAIGRIGRFCYSGPHHFQPVPHIVAECHIRTEFGYLPLGNRETLSRFRQHFFREDKIAEEAIKRIQRTRESNRIDRENRMPQHPRPRRRRRERERE